MRAPLAVLTALVLLPMAAAHGAPEPREIDDRLLADTTSSGDYGGPEGTLGDGGLDLLTLDTREGTYPGTTLPTVVFRVTVQGGEAAEHVIYINGSAEGTPFSLDLTTSDLETYTSSTFPIVRGPFDVGSDGHATAIEGHMPLLLLRLQPGDEITDITLESTKDGSAEDAMPGSWYLMGEEVPLPPTEEEAEPASLTTSGPLELFSAGSSRPLITTGPDSVDVQINATSLLEVLEQSVTLTVSAPSGITATLGDDALSLGPGSQESTTLRVEGQGEGEVKILMESDLGYARLLSIPLQGGGDFGVGGVVESGNLANGDSYQYTFTQAATFEYHCHPHPSMMGSITIQELPGGDNTTRLPPKTHIVRIVEPDDDSSTWGFEPAELTITEDDTVVWVNEGKNIHDIRGSTGLGGGAHDHGHDHDHGHEEDTDDSEKDTPAPFVLVGLLAALVVARRRE